MSSIPQLGAMYRGDFNRKFTLSEFGFRLPSCLDNRPLKFEEWEKIRPQTIHVSATPGPWELNQTGGVFTETIGEWAVNGIEERTRRPIRRSRAVAGIRPLRGRPLPSRA